ncbi:MAG: endonuclease III [Clostridiales bacterium]|nr:endonuclease III [Clostridiales bacterium]
MNTEKILKKLDEVFPTEDKCYLNHENPWQLLFATIMSAQCTDDRVNAVTEKLYKKYTSLEAFAEADIKELEADIKSTGFYHNKAKNIKAAAKMLIEEYGGVMPSEVEKLTALPGVGRKTANVVRSHIFNLPSIVVDTHVKRISKKWGFTESDDPVKIEFELMELLPEEHWIRYNTQVIALGRTICKARKPDCGVCPFAEFCPGKTL